MKVRAHVYITGKVQGVYFRQSTKRQAYSLDVTGWVRNLHDGRVEAIFEGDEEPVKVAIDFCYYGPRAAKVEKVDLIWEDYRGEFTDFKVIE